ncbi:MAG: growth inhibitor PemK [Sphingobacteriales bacterium]|nr:growth inhibitor PemK [Sphingobacteriales bacterium]
MGIKQYSIHWINLDPTIESEVNKTRPCVILSPDEMNNFIKTVIIAPLTHSLKPYPSRVQCEVNGDVGSIMLDQIRTVDKSRVGKLFGKLNTTESGNIKFVINEMLC